MDIDHMQKIVVHHTGHPDDPNDLHDWIDFIYGAFTGLIEQAVLTTRDRAVLTYRPSLRRESADAGQRGKWAGFTDYLVNAGRGFQERSKISERLDAARQTHGRRLAEDVAALLLSNDREHHRALAAANANPIEIGSMVAAIRDGAPDSPLLGPVMSAATRKQGPLGIHPEPSR